MAPSASAEPDAPVAERARTSLVWLFGDDDVLHAPGAVTPPSPAAGSDDRSGYDALGDGVSSRFNGRENRSELAVDAAAPGWLSGLSTRAHLALALELNSAATRGTPVSLEDVGSFVEARWTWGAAGAPRPDALVLRALPLNADRERVGRLESLGFGGAVGPNWDSPYATAHGPVRAVRAELNLDVFVAHVELKTASFVENQGAGPAVDETSYGYFGGLASRWSFPAGVALEVGHFEHGRLPGAGATPRATTTGAALRFHAGAGFSEPLPPSGFGLERSPFDAALDAREPPLRPGVVVAANARSDRPKDGIAVSVEAAHIVQRLWDYDRPGTAALFGGRGAGAVAQVRRGQWDLRALFTWREPAFVARQSLGVFPGEGLPRAAARRDEMLVALAAGVTLARVWTPALGVGVLLPAAVMTRGVDGAGQAVGATLVVRGAHELEALPPGAVPVPILELRPSLGVRLSSLLDVLAWAQYERDFDRTRAAPPGSAGAARVFAAPDRLGYGLAARAV